MSTLLKDIDPSKEYPYAVCHQYVSTRDDGLCVLCGREGGQMHHVLYRSHGGRHVPNNLAWLCHACHDKIHTKKDDVKELLKKRIEENEKQFRENLI